MGTKGASVGIFRRNGNHNPPGCVRPLSACNAPSLLLFQLQNYCYNKRHARGSVNQDNKRSSGNRTPLQHAQHIARTVFSKAIVCFIAARHAHRQRINSAKSWAPLSADLMRHALSYLHLQLCQVFIMFGFKNITNKKRALVSAVSNLVEFIQWELISSG